MDLAERSLGSTLSAAGTIGGMGSKFLYCSLTGMPVAVMPKTPAASNSLDAILFEQPSFGFASKGKRHSTLAVEIRLPLLLWSLLHKIIRGGKVEGNCQFLQGLATAPGGWRMVGISTSQI